MLKIPDRKTERLLELAAFFETLNPKLYNQHRYQDDSGAMCICGHVNARAGYQADDQERARDLLGISQDAARKLFAGGAGKRFGMLSGSEQGPRPKDAARALRHLAVTGEVPSFWNAPYVEHELEDA